MSASVAHHLHHTSLGCVRNRHGRPSFAASRACARRRLCVAAAQAAGSSTIPVALVTGSSTGIGNATALYLAQQGWEVFAGVRKESDRQALAQQHPSLRPLLLDVTSQASVDAAASELQEALGPHRNLSGLVNNAGKGTFGPLELMPVETFEDVMAVNVSGVLRVTQACVPLLRSRAPGQRPGRIVNLGSYAGTVALPMFGPYTVSKFGLEALSDVMRYELALTYGIGTVLIKAGAVQTPIWDKSAASSADVAKGYDPVRIKPYQRLLEKMQGVARDAEADAIPVQEAVDTIFKALTADTPRTRYLIGNGSELQMTARRLLPDWIWDKIVMSMFGPPNNSGSSNDAQDGR